MGLLFSPPNEMVEARFEDWKIADGFVKILFANGEFYEGHMKHNMRNQTGDHFYTCGDHF